MKQSFQNRWFALRHGRSEHNAAGELSCDIKTDRSNLLVESRKLILEQAQKLKEQGLSKIFASDFIRTRQTAQIVADVTGLEVETDIRLREHHFGELNGAKEHDQRLTELAKLWLSDPTLIRYLSESPSQVADRMLDFIQKKDQAFSGESIVIVSHGSPIWNLVVRLFPEDVKSLRDKLWPEPGEGLELFPRLRKI